MAANKVLETNSPLQVAVPAALQYPTTTNLSGQIAVLGSIAGVFQDNSGDATRPSPGYASFDTLGAFNLTATAATALSPLTGSAINPGDKIYLDGASTDTNTGLKYGGTLDKNSSGVYVGTAVSPTGQTGPLLASGSTGTICVRLN